VHCGRPSIKLVAAAAIENGGGDGGGEILLMLLQLRKACFCSSTIGFRCCNVCCKRSF
jgi:hypothetical protein